MMLLLAPIARRGVISGRPLFAGSRARLAAARRTYYSRPQWAALVKTAAYTAGGVALVTVAWPVVRFVVIGGLGYLTYRAVRAYLEFRHIGRMLGTSTMWEQVQRAAGMRPVSEATITAARTQAAESLRTAYLNDSRVPRMVGDAADAADLELGEALDVSSAAVRVNGREQRQVDVLFPVLVAGRAGACFVQSVWIVGDKEYRAKESTVWVRQPDGSIDSVKIDPVEAQGRRKRAHVEDADYRDL
ncbi:hypothetical protein IWW51_001157 [Coemansia sp. RSA 2702]|nr:hypothetical protein IWW54_004313 [Coemansia sp. RSA 2705]KAJ2328516.1 hypothetical protein IWW51_001157 [Coemansia sp. RSA 2702]